MNHPTFFTQITLQKSDLGYLSLFSRKQIPQNYRLQSDPSQHFVQDQLTGSDGHFLKLQNLQYQAHHLQNEIDGCLNFQSAHKKVTFRILTKLIQFQLELKPVSDFNEKAPESLREKAVSVEEDLTDAEKEHKLTLARLEWENEERNGLIQIFSAFRLFLAVLAIIG